MLWLDDPTTDDEGRQPTLPGLHSTASTITFSPPPQWRVLQRERRRGKRRGTWPPLRSSQSAFSLTSIAIDAGSSSSSLTRSLLRPSTPGHASSSSSSSSTSLASPRRSSGRVKYSKAIANLSLRRAIDMDTTSGPDSSASNSPAHLCPVEGCLACSAVSESVIPSPSGAVWSSEAELDVERLVLPAPAQLRQLSSYTASVNPSKPPLFINTAVDHVITIQEPSMHTHAQQQAELVPMLPSSPATPHTPGQRWWQRVNVPRLVVSLQCLISVLLLATAAYLTPSITHTANLLPAYLLPSALFLLCIYTLSRSTKSSSPPPSADRPVRFITLSALLSLGLLSYSLHCLFSPSPSLSPPYVFESLEQMSSSLRSFVSLSLLFFVSSIVLCSLVLLLARAPAGGSLYRPIVSLGRGKGASMRRLQSENHLEQFYLERRMARAERLKRKSQSPSAAAGRLYSELGSGCYTVSRDSSRSALLKSCVSMPCMQSVQ